MEAIKKAARSRNVWAGLMIGLFVAVALNHLNDRKERQLIQDERTAHREKSERRS